MQIPLHAAGNVLTVAAAGGSDAGANKGSVLLVNEPKQNWNSAT